MAETDATDHLDSSRQGCALIASHGAGPTSPVALPVRRWSRLDPLQPGVPTLPQGDLRD